MIDTKSGKERYILVSCSNDSEKEMKKNLEELEELVYTAGGIATCYFTQRLDTPNVKTYIGKGKIEELKEWIKEYGADAIVCDDELRPTQMANLIKELNIKVIDRTILILDIFSKRATTKEGKLQVELAQLSNYYTHLKGNVNFSRLGAGIGTRGPGEKKLELDRRYIRNNINNIKHELKMMKTHRELIRTSRERVGIYKISIVGYTNAGKSTLMNKLTNASVIAEDKLFATLDLTTRELVLPCGQKILITDTVGFINKLPHTLIESFKSTLEDAKFSDAIIHVVDSSVEDWLDKMELVYKLLKELNINNKPIITIFNKQDKVIDNKKFFDHNAKHNIKMSIINDGMNELLETIENVIKGNLVYINGEIKYSDYGLIEKIRKECILVNEKFEEYNVKFEAYVNEEIFNKIHKIKNNKILENK